MPALYLKLAGAAAILLLVAGAAGWLYRNGYAAGEATVRAREQKAVMEALKQADAQKQADAKTSADAVQGLQNELQTLRSKPQPEPVPMRLCVTPARRAVPAPAEPAGGTTSPATASGGLPSVPSGAGSGPDLGAELQRVTLAADIVSARARACLTWARGISR